IPVEAKGRQSTAAASTPRHSTKESTVMSNARITSTRRLKTLIAITLATGIGAYSLGNFVHAQQDEHRESPASGQSLHNDQALSEASEVVARTIATSVVNIRSTQRIERTSQQWSLPDNELFRRFFEDLPEEFRQFGLVM